MEKQNLSRGKGFGSSDAESIAKAGRGVITDALKMRIAEVKGLYTPKEIDTQSIRTGIEVENMIANKLGSNVTYNPLYVSQLKSTDKYLIKNHIDFEIKSNKLHWFELKTTVDDLQDAAYKYRYQLQWHWMLLKEKAQQLEVEPELYLITYNPDTQQISTSKIEWNSELQNEIDRGLEWLRSNFETIEWQQPEEMPIEAIPSGVELASKMTQAIRMIEQYNAMLDEFKNQLLNYMEVNNIKALKNEELLITYVAATKRSTFDSKKFRSDYPELYEKYKTESDTKPYVKLTLK